jgi:hypothetical protein
MKFKFHHALILLVIFLTQSNCFAQEETYRPDLLFREDWKEIPAEIPLHQGHVSNPDLVVSLYGPGSDSIKKSNHEKPLDDPYYTWSGLCLGNWAVTLKLKSGHMDLSRFSKIRWRSKQSGFRELHVLLRLADGSWLVSRQGDGASADWRVKEFNLMDLDWFTIDMESIIEGRAVLLPDLSDVAEIGYTDLMPGGQSNACSRLDWIEVYAYLVK